MALFLLIFFFLYGALHGYIFFKIRAALPLGLWAHIAIALFMALMIAAPVLVRVCERAGLDLLARLLSYVGYGWMGFAFLFLVSSLCLDLWRLFLYLPRWIWGGRLAFLYPRPIASFLIPAILAFCLWVYGYWEARALRTEEVVIKSPKVPKGMGVFTIAQISDVHLGLIVREDRLKRIIDLVEEAKPDLVVSTGDLVDGVIGDLQGLCEMWKRVRPRFGKFAVTGNHEFYAGLADALRFTEEAGFVVLRGESREVARFLVVAGVDDPAGVEIKRGNAQVARPIVDAPKDRFFLLLKHRPVIGSEGFDLQLSGHTHKGQIFPFNFLSKLSFPYDAGLFTLSDGSILYVSRGSGTWGPPIRLLAPPEVTVIRLVHGG